MFTSPRACIAAAVEMQRALCEHGWTGDERVRVRMGMHTGEATEGPVGLVGLDVHKAARVAAAANGGQVLVSEATAILVRDRLDVGVSLRDLGSHRLKDLTRPEPLFQLEAEGLETEFPPIRTLDDPSLQHNLPVQLTTFVGREAEVDELSALVVSDRLVTVTGPGGCGKTRLALQVASALLDGSGAGVWFVDLAPLSDQDLVAPTVASVLGLSGSPSASAADVLLKRLASKRLLIILDNCEHVVDSCAKLADQLLRTCPGVHLLATSREPLGIDGEHVYRIPSLGVASAGEAPEAAFRSDAVQLFVDRARVHDHDFILDADSLPVIVSICSQLDGIPLALELAAARLRSMSLVEVERRLEDRFRLVAGGNRVALARHQTLRATMDWSYESLNERDRAVFDRLSVFVGGFELDVAEGVCDSDHARGYQIADAIESLVDKSLVLRDEGVVHRRFRLNETSRQYAAERLGTDPQALETTLSAHALAFLALAESLASELTGADQDAALGRLEAERDNLRAACAHLLAEPGTPAAALRIAVALRLFWVRSGTALEGLKVVEEALKRPGVGGDPVLEARAVATAARLNLTRSAAYDLALPYVERALLLGREFCDDEFVCQLLAEKEMIQYTLGDHDGALQTADESVEVALRSGSDSALSDACNIRAWTRFYLSDIAGARDDFTKAVHHAELGGDQHSLGRVLLGFGELEEHEGDLKAAQRLWERSLELADPSAKNSTRLDLAWLALRSRDVRRASELILDTLGAIREQPEFYGCFALILAALCVSTSGSHECAAQLHGAGDTMAANAVRGIWDHEDVLRLQREDLSRLRTLLGDERFDRAYNTGLEWVQARRLATRQLAQSVSTH